MPDHLGEHAVIVGGSLAGLMTARVLSDYFARVTILERDQIADAPEIHKSIPQGNHVHALLQGGQEILAAFYPGFTEELCRLGAVRWTVGRDVAWYHPGGKSYNATGSVGEPRDLGLIAHNASRGLIEYVVRKQTLALRNIMLETGAPVHGLVHHGGRVTGVRVEGGREIAAALVVDAGGRASSAPRWLEALGCPRPEETTIGVDFAYTSAKYRRPSSYAGEAVVLAGGPPPAGIRGGGAFAIEHEILHVSLAGRFGDYPPTDADGFRAFAESLPASPLTAIVCAAERLTPITHHRFPTSILRHYERLTAFPEGFLTLGDAVCSFNPVYGQGMTSAGLQAQTLQGLLAERAAARGGLDGLARLFFPKAAEVVSTPWTLAAGFDFAYPQTRGERPAGLAEAAPYFAALSQLQDEDPAVQRLVTEVFQLTRPLAALQEEPLLGRVLARMAQDAVKAN